MQGVGFTACISLHLTVYTVAVLLTQKQRPTSNLFRRETTSAMGDEEAQWLGTNR